MNKFYLFICIMLPWNMMQCFTIMLNPAGDAQHTGRKLHDNFERGITIQYAQALKKILEQRHPHIRVILTRAPGETIAPLQHAHFANRLAVNLYLSIHFYQEHAVKPRIYMYSFSCGQEFLSVQKGLSFCPIDHAHIYNHAITRSWATQLKQALEAVDDHHQYEVKGAYHVPFKPLLGIQAPALALEIGLKDSDDWQLYVDAVADALGTLLQNCNESVA